MNMKFKKFAACLMATASLVTGMVGMSASAVEPRYGGYDNDTYNGASIEKYIDCSKSVAGGYTKCDSVNCSYAYIDVTAYHSSTGYKWDYFYVTRGKASVYVAPDSGKSFRNATTRHIVTVSGSQKELTGMSASAGL